MLEKQILPRTLRMCEEAISPSALEAVSARRPEGPLRLSLRWRRGCNTGNRSSSLAVAPLPIVERPVTVPEGVSDESHPCAA